MFWKRVKFLQTQFRERYPILSFYALDIIVREKEINREEREKMQYGHYDSIRIKDTWKTKKRLFSVENGKEGKRQYGIYWIKEGVLINWISDRRAFQVLFN